MIPYIYRTISPYVLEAHKYFPVILVSGARQVGKSTLCRHLFPDYKYVNLEDSDVYFAAAADVKAFLNSVGDKAIIDEAQRFPALFSQIQVNVDENPNLRYVLTGSSDFILMKSSCQSLAGRIALFTLPPLTFKELSSELKDIPTEQLFYRGFYPGVVSGKQPAGMFYRNYFNMYIEKDIRSQLKVGNLSKFDTFMRLMAARVGTESNASSLSVEVGVDAKTISEWTSILEASYIIFPLRPYYANISKRLTKSPKWYFYDVGLVAYLLGIEDATQLMTHPLRGALFENMAVAEMFKNRLAEVKNPNLTFYRERSGREVDVLQTTVDGINAYEIKSAKTFNSDFMKNLKYVSKILENQIKSTVVVYDGENIPSMAINVRDL